MPEPILLAMATAVASKAGLDLYGLVKRRLGWAAESDAALDAATADPENHELVAALAQHLAEAEAADPEFSAQLRAAWAATTSAADHDGVVNQVSGTVAGHVVQARDIHGDIRF